MRAFITGITGQDGSYLTELLLDKGYEVFGLVRRTSNDPFVRIDHLRKNKKLHFLYGDLRDSGAIRRALEISKPDEIYNLAAQSDVGISFKVPEETWEINYHGLGRLIHAVMDICPKAHIYHASTSEMFGSTKPPQSELSRMKPQSPYAEAKLQAHEDFVNGYRKRYGLYIVSGILFNHESPRRGEHFVTRKITISLAKIKLGMQKYFELGNLNAKRDWGYAADYVEAMWEMLQQRKPDDFVIGTGKHHSVREFVTLAGKELGFEIVWKGKGIHEVGIDQNGWKIVRVNQKYYRPKDVQDLLALPRKARAKLHWKPKTSFNELVKLMAEADFKALQHKDAHTGYN